MNKRVVVIIFVVVLSLGGIYALLSAAFDTPTASLSTNTITAEEYPLPEKKGVYINRRTDGVENSFNQSIFGPKSCTFYGDPYSPINSIWKPGLHTYRYRIVIPEDYTSDIVRVELFDPDSINNTTITTTIIHTEIYSDETGTASTIAVCDDNQRDTCVLDTDEESILNPELSYDQVNPFWMIRIDENRGRGEGDGDGHCSIPEVYTPRYNTQSIYELSYNALDNNGVPEEVILARYTGQTGDGSRDNGNHATDMRWVSPGAAQSFDQPVFVPVDSNSPGSFEVDLSQDVPNIIENPLTGERELYINVTAVSGASENGFDIWAGPPNYTQTVPSQVNARNLHIINNPQSHDSDGILIFALETLPQNSNIDIQLELPLTYLGPEYAGQVISITAFDIDAPGPFAYPIDFYVDTVAKSDWSLTYGDPPGLDPDGVPSEDRCLPGNCDDQWIDPAYQIQLPDYTDDCDLGNPDPQICTPFYGGRLMAKFQGLTQDTYAWEAYVPEPPVINNSNSCANAFPIGLNINTLSISSAGAYPNDFDYPAIPPSYQSFISHVPNTLITEAQEGTIYRLYDGNGAGNFSWLRWQLGDPDNDETLAADLTWPGVNDLSINVEDFIPGKSNTITSTVVQDELNDHIDNHRTLRLIIWDQEDSGAYRMVGIAVFRLFGYHIENIQGASWLALEFVGWDTSCGQLVVGLTGLGISGPVYGYVNSPYTFLATIQPVTATIPITYTWETAVHPPVTQLGRFQDDLTFTWPQVGTQLITVTAENKGGIIVQDTYEIEIDWRTVYLPAILR